MKSAHAIDWHRQSAKMIDVNEPIAENANKNKLSEPIVCNITSTTSSVSGAGNGQKFGTKKSLKCLMGELLLT